MMSTVPPGKIKPINVKNTPLNSQSTENPLTQIGT